MMETHIPGVFAAACPVHRDRQVVTAASDGAIAALSAEKFLHHRSGIKYAGANRRDYRFNLTAAR